MMVPVTSKNTLHAFIVLLFGSSPVSVSTTHRGRYNQHHDRHEVASTSFFTLVVSSSTPFEMQVIDYAQYLSRDLEQCLKGLTRNI